ncbi:ABC transporter substrate-binding protein [Camelliibacillus cellulosilyticus]|uniref:ABC transporter substrate-binding protein n=1 Tax=Camelliibacillus cellulosilyticus TaxID=2174486 RepID=A0ABV9GQ43_9BACL
MFKKIIMVLVLLPLLIFTAVGCQSSGGSSDKGKVEASDQPVNGDLSPLKKPVTVKIAEDGSASGAGFYIAKDKGFFKHYNINVKFVKFSNSDDMLPALAAGKIDVAGGISSASFFNSIAQGIDVKMIADKGHNLKGQSYFSFVIRKDLQDKIKSYKDFKGKRIAVSTKNGVDDYIFQQMLDHAGLKRKDVKFELMSDFGNMLAAMQSKSIDAALQIEPLITKGESSGIHVRFGDATDYAPKAQIAMVLASPDFVKNDNSVALRFMMAYLKGVRAYNDAFLKGKGDKQEIIKIMENHTALKDDAIWDKVGVTGLDPDGKMFVNNIKDQYEWYKSRGGIEGKVDLGKAVDTKLAEKAVKILGEYK